MMRILTVLIIIFLLTLSACNLQAPEGEPPTVIAPGTQTQEVIPVEPTEVLPSSPVPTNTETLPPPTAAPPTEEPPTLVPPSETSLPATQAFEPVESQPTDTSPTPTANSALPLRFDPVVSYGEPTYENPMTVPVYWEWEQAETDILPNNQKIRLQFKDGNLYVTGKRKNFSTWWFSGHFLQDAYIEMTYGTEDCTGSDAYGMIVRGSPHNAGISYGYVVAFTCDGGFFMFRLDDADPWEIQELEEADMVKVVNSGPYEENVVGVRTVGDQLTVYANGIRVATVEDDHFEKGRVGVFVRSSTNNPYIYRVKNFAYWTLDEDE